MKTAIGLVPAGNTGGSNINPFKKLPISSKHQAAITKAKSRAEYAAVLVISIARK